MSPKEFLQELSTYELVIERHRHKRRDMLTTVISCLIGLAGLALLFLFDSGDYLLLAGGLLVMAGVIGVAIAGRSAERTGRSTSSSQRSGNSSGGAAPVIMSTTLTGGGDPKDDGSDTTVVTLRKKTPG